MYPWISFLLSLLFWGAPLLGCAHLVESSKTVWGSSTRALEQARTEALKRSYRADFGECFDSVLAIVKESGYTIFIQDRVQRHIVVIGIPGNVDTTEVGIFFDPQMDGKVKIDISSLSSTAKAKVAEAIFPELDKKFKSYD